MKKIEEIFSSLGLTKDNGLFITKEANWKKETAFPNRVQRLIDNEIKPDAFFCFDNKPMILFFCNPADKQKLHKAIWNFNECPIVIIIENNIVEIFNGFHFDKESKLLKILGKDEKLDNFSYFELVTGRTWKQYEDELNYKNRVDYHLLQNIKAARKILVEKNNLDSKIANAIIGKSIFVRYLIDRKVQLKFDGKLRTWTNQEFYKLLDNTNDTQQFFNYLEDKETGFNGDLFPLNAEEYCKIESSDYQIIKNLLEGVDIEQDQPSLFEFYDFSIIPIEFISNVYELFIGQNNQKKEGAYYTPLFLVDYILKETVDKKLSIVGASYNCKVLDPACGSGIFLVETLRKVIEKFIETGVDVKSEKFKSDIKILAQENIFGIDKDISAIQVAIFSIYLTLLDYLTPPEIETFKFPPLLNTNFFEADFFNEDVLFNSQFKEKKLDFILGNPPWKGNGMDEWGNMYLKNRKKREKSLNKKYSIAINNNEIAEGFVLRVSDFCNEKTKVSFIVRSSSLYNLGYNDNCSPFRQYWTEEYFIDKVFELAPVRHEVFEKSNLSAVAPAAILFYRYANGQSTDNNIVEHITLKKSRFFTLFKIFTINRTDYKNVQQKKLKDFDWLWKILVYGSYLDFNFIKRLKEEFQTIKDFISDENRFVVGTGIQFSSKPTYDSQHLIGKPFIDTYGVKSFFIMPEKISNFLESKVHRLRDERLFKAPMLLIREGIDMDMLTAKCAISKNDVLFKDSISSIKVVQKADTESLNNIAAIFSSSLFSYYAINMFASIGIEREMVKNYNKYSSPYIELNAKNSINTIELAHQKIYEEKQNATEDNIEIHRLNNLIRKEQNKIDESIYLKLGLNDLESALIEYALEINRNLIIGSEIARNILFSALPYEDVTLGNYANIFIKRFKTKLETKEKKFVVEIWHSDQLVSMFFKLVPIAEDTKNIKWISMQNKDFEILTFFTKIGSERITDKLFIQKDIRGFEKDSFYIAKPNEKRLWHKAIAYLDVTEFADAVLKAGRKSK